MLQGWQFKATPGGQEVGEMKEGVPKFHYQILREHLEAVDWLSVD